MKFPSFNEKQQNIIIICLFAIMFFVGIRVASDYGGFADMATERLTSLVNVKEAARVFNIAISDKSLISKAPDIDQYGHNKYYGVAAQIPPTIIELLISDKYSLINDFSQINATPLDFIVNYYYSAREFYLVRNYWVFIVFFVSLIVFYFLCLRLINSKLFAFIGVLMIFLYPRFFAASHYNIKDMVFASLFIIALYAGILFLLNRRKMGYAVLSGFLLALASNARFYGFALFGCIVCLMLFEDIAGAYLERKKLINRASIEKDNASRKKLVPYFILSIVFFASFIIMMPYSWKTPFPYAQIKFLFEYFKTFFGFSFWDEYFLFFGNLIRKDETRFMFTTWLGLSVPIVYLYFALAGSCLVVKNIFAKRAFVLNLFENRFLVLTAVLFFAPFFATVLIKGLIYDTWRHLYFTFPLLIILALYGAKMIYEMFENKARYGVFVFLFGALIFQGCWIIKNHPYQDAYFNIVGAQIADKFMRDYYAASTHQALIYLLQNEPSNKQISAAYYPFPAQVAVSLSMFSYRDKMRFRPVQDIEHAEYVISHFYNTAGNELKIKGFVEMHAIWIDGYKILTILKRI